MDVVVSLETAQKLAEAGYPQKESFLEWVDLGWPGDPSLRLGTDYVGLAAPSHLQALEWLEEQGFPYGRYYQCGIPLWYCRALKHITGVRSPDALICAVLDRLKEKTTR